MKRTALLRRTPLRARARPRKPTPGKEAWDRVESGFCECGCGRVAWRLHRHHVLLRQIVEREGADPWSLRNSMLIAPDCHAAHHAGSRKIRVSQVPDEAVAFTFDVLGEHRAADYFHRRYSAA